MAKTFNDTLAPKDARNERPPSNVRSGFIVIKRNPSAGLLKAASTPFEHATLDEALAHAQTLANERDAEFCVFTQVQSFRPEPKPVPTEAPPAPPPPPQVAASGRKVIGAKAGALPPPIPGKAAPTKAAGSRKR